MLRALNFFILQWTSYRLGRVVLTDTGEDAELAIVGPLWPLCGFFGPVRAMYKDNTIQVVRIMTRVHDRDRVDYTVRLY